MNTDTGTRETATRDDTGWELPDLSIPFSEGPGRTGEDWADYRELVSAITEIASAMGWTKKATAEKIGLKEGTFSQWQAKKYTSRYDTHNAQVRRFIDQLQASQDLSSRMPQPLPFMRLDSAVDILDTLLAAQMLPDMAMVCAGAGVGKTMACRHYVMTHPNAHLVTMPPLARSHTVMLAEIADQLNVPIGGGAREQFKAIAKRISRPSASPVLIVDECQHLSDEAINQLRFFLDMHNIGVALVGNEESYSRFSNVWSGLKYGQLRRRIFTRLHIPKSRPGDVARFIKALGVTDKDMTAFLTGIAAKPGALGQVDKTWRRAAVEAHGTGREITLQDLRRAWQIRNVEA